MIPHFNVIIIGSGPAAYTACLYTKHHNPLILRGEMGPGGQLTTTTNVDNYPGFPEGIQGPDLMEDMYAHCLRSGLGSFNGRRIDNDEGRSDGDGKESFNNDKERSDGDGNDKESFNSGGSTIKGIVTVKDETVISIEKLFNEESVQGGEGSLKVESSTNEESSIKVESSTNEEGSFKVESSTNEEGSHNEQSSKNKSIEERSTNKKDSYDTKSSTEKSNKETSYNTKSSTHDKSNKEDSTNKERFKSKHHFKITTKTSCYTSNLIIIATGATARRLNVKGTEKYWTKGISSCAVCDGYFYMDKVCAVIGGGDSAMEEVLFLSKICKKVYLIHRNFNFKARIDKVDEVKMKSNIEIVVPYKLIECGGLSEECGDKDRKSEESEESGDKDRKSEESKECGDKDGEIEESKESGDKDGEIEESKESGDKDREIEDMNDVRNNNGDVKDVNDNGDNDNNINTKSSNTHASTTTSTTNTSTNNTTPQDDILTYIKIQNTETSTNKTLKIDGLFFGIGHDPNTSFINDNLGILDNDKYIIVDSKMRTKVEGIFACGDVCDKLYRQAVTAAYMGCVSGIECSKMLEK